MGIHRISRHRMSLSLFLLLVYIISTVVVFLGELVSRQNVESVFLWIIENSQLFFTSGLLVFTVLLLVFTLTGKVYISFFLVQLSVFILSGISYFKQSQRNEPLYAVDIALSSSILGVTDANNVWLTKTMVYVFFGLILLTLALYRMQKKFLWSNINRRAFCLLVSLLLGSSLLYTSFFKSNLWNDVTYSSKGFVLGFVSHAFYDSAKELDNYNKSFLEDTIMELKKGILKRDSEDKPNVIVVLSESFFDVTQIENLQLSGDPVPNFREYKEKYTQGNMGAITFGGGTNRVECEFLTGFLNRYVPSYDILSDELIKEEINALPNIFKYNGYETIAIHTYYKSFYNRDIYYDKFGFDKFIGYEDMENIEYSGKFISDDYFASQIIDAFENKNGAAFIYGLSMENHQPYNDKYDETEIKILNQDISEEMRELGENYIQGLNNADKSLKKIIDYFENVDEKTIVLFFGDHFPTLGADFKFYRELGFVNSNGELNEQELLKIVTPQFLLYSNYDLPKQDIDLIGTNFLGNYLLNLIEIKKPLFFYFIDEAYQRSDYMSRNDLFVGKDKRVYDSIPYYFRETDEQYKMLQHDILSQDSYILDELNEFY